MTVDINIKEEILFFSYWALL